MDEMTHSPDQAPDFFDQDGPGLFDEPDPPAAASAKMPATPDAATDARETAPAQAAAPAGASKPDVAASAPTLTHRKSARPKDIPDAPLALYRRYRPDTFADVIGQEHVTEPLMRALENNRVNHAYLFSGPRGCGKTTSARILARALNCENGPVAVPCGECLSCNELARGGSGSIDVIEIDAASHGNVDEARDLRERAFFAPVRSRFKIYIIDEAHMVTPQGFNALLKVVEEPPPHVKFIFATTEPEKVLGTIRSRTHHYPFRLVPPKTLTDYLARLCQAEGVALDRSVLPLVVRAGGGSVRDSLSVLDQLLGGAGSGGVTYQQASALLGYTPETLLDDLIDSFAASDASGVFSCIDRVIESGQDPRRFGEDVLERLRDLIIVDAVPEALSNGLVTVSADQADRLRTQAAAMGPGELARAGEVMANGLQAMRGTTSPRLFLELMCARVLLPGADVDERGIHARLDRIERRLGMGRAGLEHTGAIPKLSGGSLPTIGSSPSGSSRAAAAAQAAPGRSGAGAAGRPGAAAPPTSAKPVATSAGPATSGYPTSGPGAPTGGTPSDSAAGGDSPTVGATETQSLAGPPTVAPRPGATTPGAPAAGSPAPAAAVAGTATPGTPTPGTPTPGESAPRSPAPAAAAAGTTAPGLPAPGTPTLGAATPGTATPVAATPVDYAAGGDSPAVGATETQSLVDSSLVDSSMVDSSMVGPPTVTPRRGAATPGTPSPGTPTPGSPAATADQANQSSSPAIQPPPEPARPQPRTTTDPWVAGPAGAPSPVEVSPADAPAESGYETRPTNEDASVQLNTADLRRMWPQVLDELSNLRRFAWVLISQNSHVVGVDGQTVTLGMASPGARDSFDRGGCADIVAQAIANITGTMTRVEAIIDGGDQPRTRPTPPAPRPKPEPDPWAQATPATDFAQAARSNIRPTRQGAPEVDEMAEPSRSDIEIPEDGRDAPDVLAAHLGAQLIDEE